jgi:hypothetical protein
MTINTKWNALLENIYISAIRYKCNIQAVSFYAVRYFKFSLKALKQSIVCPEEPCSVSFGTHLSLSVSVFARHFSGVW